MTTMEIRRNIEIVNHWLNVNTLSISYRFKGELNTYIAFPKDAVTLLSSALIIDSYEELWDSVIIIMDEKRMSWEQFSTTYKLGQYDCIEIITRILLAKELDNDSALLEMDAAINALKNN